MPKNNVNDLITDQEIAFAHLILSGTMNDRRAAEAVGLTPDSAAGTRSKPCVRAYMLEQRAAVQQPHEFNLGRDQVLARLWEIANLDPERTRSSASAQVKALSMIVAMEGLIPDSRAVAVQSKPAPPPVPPPFYVAAWRRQLQEENREPHSSPPPVHQEAELPSPASVPYSTEHNLYARDR